MLATLVLRGVVSSGNWHHSGAYYTDGIHNFEDTVYWGDNRYERPTLKWEFNLD